MPTDEARAAAESGKLAREVAAAETAKHARGPEPTLTMIDRWNAWKARKGEMLKGVGPYEIRKMFFSIDGSLISGWARARGTLMGRWGGGGGGALPTHGAHGARSPPTNLLLRAVATHALRMSHRFACVPRRHHNVGLGGKLLGRGAEVAPPWGRCLASAHRAHALQLPVIMRCRVRSLCAMPRVLAALTS